MDVRISSSPANIGALPFPITLVYSYTNINTLGAVTNAASVFTLVDSRVIIRNCYLEVLSPAAGVSTLTASVGRTSPNYDDYICYADLKTINLYGVDTGSRGFNLSMFDVPSITNQTSILLNFTSSGGNLSDVTNLSFKLTMEVSKLT